jgi:hypothetical protein
LLGAYNRGVFPLCLSDELLNKIFGYIRTQELLSSVVVVCKRTYALIKTDSKLRKQLELFQTGRL